MRRALLILVAGSLATAAHAAAPEPRRPLNLDRFMGRWHEILRTPNSNEADCASAYQDWSKAEGGFAINQHCRKADGSNRTVKTKAKVLNPPSNTKFEASFFGGLVKGRYWVVDHADDYRWMIATTEDGRYPALLARSATLPAAETAQLKQRIGKLGFDTAKLQSGAVASKTAGDDKEDKPDKSKPASSNS